MKAVAILLIVFCLIACEEKKEKNYTAGLTSEAGLKIQLVPLVENIYSPVALTHAGDSRLFIVEQPGTIRIIKEGKLLPKPYLDISSKVDAGKGYSEKGLLGLAFHPDYKTNGRFFIYYSAPLKEKGSDHKSIVSEYRVSDNPDIASVTEKILLEIPQPESNHNGGHLTFGADGFLYIGLGDGGGANDQHGKIGNAQNLQNLLGKIIRIDVDGGSPYAIPEGNPFASTPNARPEIWAYGLRNPWKFSFDRRTGELFCGDVGQNAIEEIDLIRKGGNYGWRAMEGTRIADKALQTKEMIGPINEYPREVGICVIGGYVYRGRKYPELTGNYFFADWTGKIFYLNREGADQWSRALVHKSAFLINSLGEDLDGELYILGQKESGVESKTGAVYRLVEAR